ncbi:hypothetical protein, partial [Rhizobium anhuiense]
VMRCCAAEMAPHRNPPLPPRTQQPKTAGANSKLDKTWGQGHRRKEKKKSADDESGSDQDCPHGDLHRNQGLGVNQIRT